MEDAQEGRRCGWLGGEYMRRGDGGRTCLGTLREREGKMCYLRLAGLVGLDNCPGQGERET